MSRESAAAGGRTFTFLGPNTASLDARMNGTAQMSDGNSLSTWHFGSGFNDDRTVPSPVIEAHEGALVQVTLSSMMPHSIHFHGLDVDQANDGVPSTSGYISQMGGGGGGGFGRVDGYTNLGSPFAYEFLAPHAGTYMYHCHVDTVLHIERGMYGTVIVRPPDGDATRAWAGGPVFQREYVWHLHTFDSSWHSGGMVSGPGTVRHQPDYFLLNGRDGVSATTDPTSRIEAVAGQRVLIRAINVGYQPAIVRLDGLAFEVIASDGRPLAQPVFATDQLVAPGERYDLLFSMPPALDRQATIDYLDIRLRQVLGTVQTPLIEASSEQIFADGFESGDTSEWD